MEEWVVFVAGAIFLVALASSMARLGAGWGGQVWSIGWACLWGSGFAAVFAPSYPELRPLAPILGTAFGGLMIRGTMWFTGTGHDRVRLLLGATVAVALGRVAIEPFVSVGTRELVGALMTTAAIGVCSWLFLNPTGRDVTPWERVLASVFPSITVVSWYFAYLTAMDLPRPSSVFAWFLVGLTLTSLKTGAFVARSRDRMEQLRVRAEDSEEEKDRLEARYRDIAENASDLIAEVDSSGRLVYANPAFIEILGLKPESLIGRSAEDLLFSSTALEIDDDGSGAPIAPQTLVVRHADGRLVTLECHLRRFELGGRETGIVVTGRDVTDRAARDDRNAAVQAALEVAVEEQTEALRSSLAELQQSQRLASLGTMAAGIAHQINNPIGSIQVASEFALGAKAAERDEAWQDALENSVEQARRCGRIVSSMLQFARNESTVKAPEDLAAILRRACEQTERHAAASGAVIDASGVESPLPILASSIELEQAMLNVLRNACESSEERVRVEVRARRSDRLATVTITDDGRGMSSDEIEHAFDPFYTTRLRRGGTGLGLSVAHGIVSDHEGLVSVESEPGRGTTIAITLPLREPTAAAAPTTR